MNFYKTSLIAPTLALLLYSNLNAEESYSVQNKSLKEALELISKQSNTPYMADGKLLKGKKAPNITNIEGLENALKKVLKGTKLEAVIEDGTILIRKKVSNKKTSLNSLGEVIITGTKLNKSLQDTVESVQVFNEEDISNSSKMNTLSDIFEQTSSVSRSGDYGIKIRGISDAGFGGSSGGPKTIDVNIDGVSQGPNATGDAGISTWDLEQVEILKGPQSTTQGRNSLSGAIILKTKNPEFESNGAVKVDYSTNNTSRLSVMQTGPITDNLAFRLTAERSASDGFVENDNIDGDKFNESKSSNIRGKLLYTFDNGADAILTLNKVKTDEDGSSNVSKNDPFERKNYYSRSGYQDTDVKSYSLEINQPINNAWDFKSLTSYTSSEYDSDLITNEEDADSFFIENKVVDDIAQEFRFTYKKDKLNALFGFYVADGSSESNNNVKNQPFKSVGGLNLNTQNERVEDYTNIALFTNIDYELTDKLTLIAGLRIDRDDRASESIGISSRATDYSTDNEALVEYLIQDTSTFSAVTSEAVAQAVISASGGTAGLGNQINAGIDTAIDEINLAKLEADNSTTNVLPKLGLNYKWNNNINTGLLISQGYRPGGISLYAGSAKVYKAEYTDNIELSFRSQWLEKRLTVNANIFHTKYTDIQTSELDDDGIFHVTNAGKATLKGIELDTKYLVNDELDIFGSIGYNQTKFDDYRELKGNEFSNTPNITANIGATYRANNGYFIGGNMNYTGDSFVDNDNTVETKSYTLTNVKVGYERDDWAVYLYSNNIFDKEYLIRNATSTGNYIMGDPRIVGVTLTYNW